MKWGREKVPFKTPSKFPTSGAQAGNEERKGERGKKKEEKALLFRVIFLGYY